MRATPNVLYEADMNVIYVSMFIYLLIDLLLILIFVMLSEGTIVNVGKKKSLCLM